MSHLKAVALVSRGGDLIFRLPQPRPAEVASILVRQALALQLISYTGQHPFNIDIELTQANRGSTLVKGDKVGFTINSEEKSYLLLIDVDAQGIIHVLYPHHRTELKLAIAGQPLVMNNITSVIPPFGRDYIIAYAFKRYDQLLDSLRGKSFSLESKLADQLWQLITTQDQGIANNILELYTTDS